MFWCLKKTQKAPRPSEYPPFFGRGADRPPKQAKSVARQGYLGLCVLWSLSLSLQSVPRCKKSCIVCLEAEELMFLCSLIGGANRPLKEAMPVAILAQHDLGHPQSNNYRGPTAKADSPVTRRSAGCE